MGIPQRPDCDARAPKRRGAASAGAGSQVDSLTQVKRLDGQSFQSVSNSVNILRDLDIGERSNSGVIMLVSRRMRIETDREDIDQEAHHIVLDAYREASHAQPTSAFQ